MTVADILNTYRQNRKWVDRNLNNLTADYANQYVAVLNQSVIAAAGTIENLHQACSKLSPPPARDEMTVAFISKEPRGMLL